jgi:GTP-binding protein
VFVDKVTVRAIAGSGGRGCVAFRREKGVPEGGPAGGDGGGGGSVIVVADPSMRTLIDFQFRPEFKGGRGDHGEGSRRHGRNAEDVLMRVPLGTVVRDTKTGQVLGDMVEPGARVVVAKAGRGGRGNCHFVNSREQAPRFAEPGERGEERMLDLELRLLADVGLVGLPNAGKSLLLTKISAAHPKVADYPFTTKEPHLGVVSLGKNESFVVADLPGLIAGAHLGAGLGHEFLRHVSRTRVLVHMVDTGTEMSVADLVRDYETIVDELRQHDPELAKRPRILAGNKTDLPGAARRFAALRKHAVKRGVRAKNCVAISALTGTGVKELLREMQRVLAGAEAPELKLDMAPGGTVVLTPRGISRVKVVRDQRGRFLVRGRELERIVARVYAKSGDALRVLKNDFDRLGVEDALVRAGAKRGDVIRIGHIDFEYVP